MLLASQCQEGLPVQSLMLGPPTMTPTQESMGMETGGNPYTHKDEGAHLVPSIHHQPRGTPNPVIMEVLTANSADLTALHGTKILQFSQVKSAPLKPNLSQHVVDEETVCGQEA